MAAALSKLEVGRSRIFTVLCNDMTRQVRAEEELLRAHDELETRVLSRTADLRKANVGSFDVMGTEIVGPSVGQELRTKGFWATVLSLVGILGYLAFRYQLSFGVGAVVATVRVPIFAASTA